MREGVGNGRLVMSRYDELFYPFFFFFFLSGRGTFLDSFLSFRIPFYIVYFEV